MDSPEQSPVREHTTPFLLKLFYRTGAFHRPDEFSHPHSLPPHLHLHASETTTLLDLTHHLAASQPASFPSPAIGTRLAFRHVYQDTRPAPGISASSSAHQPPRFVAKDLGSLVIGEGGPGLDADDAGDPDADDDQQQQQQRVEGVVSAAAKTLADAKFVVGDYLSCAILPPDAGTGAVAPAVVRAEVHAPPPSLSLGQGRRDNGVYVAGPRGRGRGGRGGGGGGGGDRAFGVPMGEWRRGEQVPDAGHRGGRRGGGRW